MAFELQIYHTADALEPHIDKKQWKFIMTNIITLMLQN